MNYQNFIGSLRPKKQAASIPVRFKREQLKKIHAVLLDCDEFSFTNFAQTAAFARMDISKTSDADVHQLYDSLKEIIKQHK